MPIFLTLIGDILNLFCLIISQAIAICLKKIRTLCTTGNGNRGDYQNADLKQVDLSGIDLTGADLSGADLSNANLQNALLEGANLSNCKAGGTDFTGAIINNSTNFENF